MSTIKTILKVISDALGAVAMLFLGFLMFGITADVIVRALSGSPISGVFEMSELSLVMIVFLGAMWAQGDRAHIRVDLLSRQIRGRARKALMAVGWGFGALALVMLAWPATQEAIYSVSIWEFRWGYIQMPIWWTKIGLAAGLWLAAIQMTCHAVFALAEDDAGDPQPVAGA